jgi:acetylornithine deacetylase/succinyl-diaminopimelate desuccinylase-like protein
LSERDSASAIRFWTNEGKFMRNLLTCLLLLATSTSTARARDWDDEVTRAAQANFPEYLDLLAIPNVADKPADIQRNAAFLEAALKRRGFRTQLMANPVSRPEVFARLDSTTTGAKTILFYIHFDGQPVIAEEWAQKSPFTPVVKQRDAKGVWREVSPDRLLATTLDPELRVYARAAADDKAPIMMFLTAIDLMRSQGRAPPYDIKLILDSEPRWPLQNPPPVAGSKSPRG